MLIEYIRKGSKKSKKKVHPKRGVMLSYAAEGKVLIGFSLCHSKFDRYDFIKEMRVPHHGFKIALERATTWVDKENFTIKGTPGSFPHYVVVPESIRKKVHKFITRTTQYYSDKTMPIWALRFKDYMDRLDQHRHKPHYQVVKEEKGVREADCCS
jgi:hypothetical protein